MKPIAVLKSVRKDATAIAMRLAALALVALPNTALAQVAGFDGNTPLVKLACNVVSILSGPAAFLIGLVVIVVGGVAIAIGGKKVIGGVVWGILGVGIAISATNIATGIFGANSLCSTGS